MGLYIETERTYIRELQPEDEEGMYEMDSDPQVHKYVGQRPVRTRGESAAVIQFIRQQYIDNNIGRWAVIGKEKDEFLGWAGFKLMHETINGVTGHYDFGYRLKQSAWGKGIATEAGGAALHFGITKLGLAPVYAMTDVNNGASRHILEKLGFQFVTIIRYDGPSAWPPRSDPRATWYQLDAINQAAV
jgi:ribosomal-protein-alanine N-acetyltransferase